MKKFDFDDILLKPNVSTDINSRSKIDIYYHEKLYDLYEKEYFDCEYLPLITAPMDTVVNLKNMDYFHHVGIHVALPRTISYDQIHVEFEEHGLSDSITFISLGLDEMQILIDDKSYDYVTTKYFLLDVANGHMQRVYDTAKAFKKEFPNTKLMIGNIANPETYEWYARGGFVDYIRVGIGNGNACLTTKQTSIGYPKASLIHETYKIKEQLRKDLEYDLESYNNPKLKILNLKKPTTNLPKIVADGGIKDYTDIIKALGLGADYVMIGSLFNKALESSGDNYLYNWKISSNLAETLFDKGFPIKKHFYGMSTKIAQQKMGKKFLKTSEGVVRKQKVGYKIGGWTENFESYLRTAMSYSNANNLEEFIGKAEFNIITENAFNRFNK